MKKILLCLGLLAVCGFSFGETFKNSEKLVETFFAKGQCLKINEDSNNIFYISRNCIDEIDINETEMVVTTRLFYKRRENVNFVYDVMDWKIENDENGNLVVTKKVKPLPEE